MSSSGISPTGMPAFLWFETAARTSQAWIFCFAPPCWTISCLTRPSRSLPAAMLKLVLYPSRPACTRRIRTQREWNVHTVISSAAFRRTSDPTRSRISQAALLVNVTARMLPGSIPFPRRFAMRKVTVRVLPVPAPARIRRGPSVLSTASACAAFNPDNNEPVPLAMNSWFQGGGEAPNRKGQCGMNSRVRRF